MNKKDENTKSKSSIAAQTVADYLQSHPDFFSHNPDLITKLYLSHSHGGAISLIERQVSLLREQNRQLKKKLDELTIIARQNEVLFQRLHQLSLRLINAATLDAVFLVLYHDLKNNFNVDRVVVRLFTEAVDDMLTGDELVGADCPQRQLFASVFDKNLPLSGRLSDRQQAFLFYDDVIASAVLIPLQDTGWDGILAIGSLDIDYFYPDIGVDLLHTLGKTLSLVIKPWLKKSA